MLKKLVLFIIINAFGFGFICAMKKVGLYIGKNSAGVPERKSVATFKMSKKYIYVKKCEQNEAIPLLHRSISEDAPLQEIENLIEKGADINEGLCEYSDGTPLILAIDVNNSAVVELLCKKGAYINKGETNFPLEKAAFLRRVAIVKILLAHKADVGYKDCLGNTALYRAVVGITGFDTPQRRAQALTIMELLLEHGADINQANNYGATPLRRAQKKDYSEVVVLFEKYALLTRNKAQQIVPYETDSKQIIPYKAPNEILRLTPH